MPNIFRPMCEGSLTFPKASFGKSLQSFINVNNVDRFGNSLNCSKCTFKISHGKGQLQGYYTNIHVKFVENIFFFAGYLFHTFQRQVLDPIIFKCDNCGPNPRSIKQLKVHV